jgi:hypothetical protein
MRRALPHILPRGLGGRAPTRRVVVEGTISSIGFDSGDRFVVGCWPRSPLGPIADVMWATAMGVRVLLAPNAAIADFVTSIYRFDEVRVGSLSVERELDQVRARGLGIDLELVGGRHRPVPIRRPLWVTRAIEAPIARALMGVKTFGVSPTGAREWYQTTGWRWIIDGRGSVDGRDLGSLGPIEPPVGVGFSEPPRRPSIVSVRVTIDLPDAQPTNPLTS